MLNYEKILIISFTTLFSEQKTEGTYFIQSIPTSWLFQYYSYESGLVVCTRHYWCNLNTKLPHWVCKKNGDSRWKRTKYKAGRKTGTLKSPLLIHYRIPKRRRKIILMTRQILAARGGQGAADEGRSPTCDKILFWRDQHTTWLIYGVVIVKRNVHVILIQLQRYHFSNFEPFF